MSKLLIRRVSFGRKDTPPHRREYVLTGTSGPVGFRRDWEKYAKEHDADGVKVIRRWIE